jgi:hydrogenase expression/formation protein HypE
VAEARVGETAASLDGNGAAHAGNGGAAKHAATPPVSEREQRILGIIQTARAKQARFRDPHITMAHGAGGKATQTLIEGLFVPAYADASADAGLAPSADVGFGPPLGTDGFACDGLAALADAGALAIDGLELALTTDSFVVKPIRFPGGSIGELAVNGTVNDLAVAGARPLALTVSLVLEEGLDADVLRAEVQALAAAARAAGVAVVAGDTKVVERGHCDSMYLCTTGLGRRDPRARLAPDALRPGDRLLVSGPIGDHGTAIMLARGELGLEADIASDTRPLWPAVDALLDAAGPALHCLRDATRGGVASVLNELARASQVAMVVREADVPVRPAVAGAAELLGIDPLYVANEGQFVAALAPAAIDTGLAALRAVPGFERATEFGVVKREPPGMVLVETAFGGRRVLDQLVGDPLPRIC